MSPEEKRSYLSEIKRRYGKASRQKKAVILDEFFSVCHYHRKYAIRLLNKSSKKKLQKRGRKSRYKTSLLLAVLKTIWLATDQLCSKRLKVALPEWLPHYEQEYGPLEVEIKSQLCHLSPATIDRLLKPIRVHGGRRGLRGTRPGRLLKNQIAIKTDH